MKRRGECLTCAFECESAPARFARVVRAGSSSPPGRLRNLLLHAIVQAFAGIAQMVESTFVATPSSFVAMVGVVDQRGQLHAPRWGVFSVWEGGRNG